MAYSLSYIKKRTSAINKLLGTHYSPTAIYKGQENLQIGALIKSIQDPRSVQGAAGIARAGMQIMQWEWSNLASANTFVNAVLTYTTPSGEYKLVGGTGAGAEIVYKEGEVWVAIDTRTGAQRILTQDPGGVPLTPETSNRILSQKAKEIKTRKQSSPTENYQDE